MTTTHQPIDRAEFTAERLLPTAVEAAATLRVSRTTVYSLIKDGALRPVHIGRSCRISRAELERYVARIDAQSDPAASIAPTPAPAPSQMRTTMDIYSHVMLALAGEGGRPHEHDPANR